MSNPNIQVEITDTHEFHCFRLTLNPRRQPDLDTSLEQDHDAFVDFQMRLGVDRTEAERRWLNPGHAQDLAAAREEAGLPGPGDQPIEIMLHARSLVDLIHKCSLALCDWQKATTEDLLMRMTGLTRDELREIIAQMSPELARDHARAITEAAEAAEQDAFLMQFAQSEMGLDFQTAGRLLVAFREFRAQNTGKSQGPTTPRDWVMPPADKIPDYGDFTKKRPKP